MCVCGFSGGYRAEAGLEGQVAAGHPVCGSWTQEFPAFSRRSILGQVWRGWAEARHGQEGFPPMLRWTQGLGGSLVVSLVKWSLCLWLG